MKELYFFDETFYWRRSGKRATVTEAVMISIRFPWVAFPVKAKILYYDPHCTLVKPSARFSLT